MNDIFEISTDKETYKKDETLNFSIKNIGKKLSLMLGRDFRIEKFNGETVLNRKHIIDIYHYLWYYMYIDLTKKELIYYA